MNSLDKIKFREAGNGQFIKIFLDDIGNELSRTATFSETNKPKTMGAGLWNEMQEWLKISGNEIEPQFTTEEQVVKDNEAAAEAAVAWIGEREAEYIKEGCTPKALIIALWERVVEGRPETSDALEIKRQAVKIRIPKP